MNCPDPSYTAEKSISEAGTSDIKAKSNKSSKSEIGEESSKTGILDAGTDRAIFEGKRTNASRRGRDNHSDKAVEASLELSESVDEWFKSESPGPPPGGCRVGCVGTCEDDSKNICPDHISEYWSSDDPGTYSETEPSRKSIRDDSMRRYTASRRSRSANDRWILEESADSFDRLVERRQISEDIWEASAVKSSSFFWSIALVWRRRPPIKRSEDKNVKKSKN